MEYLHHDTEAIYTRLILNQRTVFQVHNQPISMEVAATLVALHNMFEKVR